NYLPFYWSNLRFERDAARRWGEYVIKTVFDPKNPEAAYAAADEDGFYATHGKEVRIFQADTASTAGRRLRIRGSSASQEEHKQFADEVERWIEFYGRQALLEVAFYGIRNDDEIEPDWIWGKYETPTAIHSTQEIRQGRNQTAEPETLADLGVLLYALVLGRGEDLPLDHVPRKYQELFRHPFPQERFFTTSNKHVGLAERIKLQFPQLFNYGRDIESQVIKSPRYGFVEDMFKYNNAASSRQRSSSSCSSCAEGRDGSGFSSCAEGASSCEEDGMVKTTEETISKADKGQEHDLATQEGATKIVNSTNKRSAAAVASSNEDAVPKFSAFSTTETTSRSSEQVRFIQGVPLSEKLCSVVDFDAPDENKDKENGPNVELLPQFYTKFSMRNLRGLAQEVAPTGVSEKDSLLSLQRGREGTGFFSNGLSPHDQKLEERHHMLMGVAAALHKVVMLQGRIRPSGSSSCEEQKTGATAGTLPQRWIRDKLAGQKQALHATKQEEDTQVAAIIQKEEVVVPPPLKRAKIIVENADVGEATKGNIKAGRARAGTDYSVFNKVVAPAAKKDEAQAPKSKRQRDLDLQESLQVRFAPLNTLAKEDTWEPRGIPVGDVRAAFQHVYKISPDFDQNTQAFREMQQHHPEQQTTGAIHPHVRSLVELCLVFPRLFRFRLSDTDFSQTCVQARRLRRDPGGLVVKRLAALDLEEFINHFESKNRLVRDGASHDTLMQLWKYKVPAEARPFAWHAAEKCVGLILNLWRESAMGDPFAGAIPMPEIKSVDHLVALLSGTNDDYWEAENDHITKLIGTPHPPAAATTLALAAAAEGGSLYNSGGGGHHLHSAHDGSRAGQGSTMPSGGSFGGKMYNMPMHGPGHVLPVPPPSAGHQAPPFGGNKGGPAHHHHPQLHMHMPPHHAPCSKGQLQFLQQQQQQRSFDQQLGPGGKNDGGEDRDQVQQKQGSTSVEAQNYARRSVNKGGHMNLGGANYFNTRPP
ncbi:unnamed protein product, partial [Amoebophrya sp. A120]